MMTIRSSRDANNGKPNTLLLMFCAVVTYISIAISDGHYLPLAYPNHTESRENPRNCLCYLLKHIVLCFYQFFLLCVIFVCSVIMGCFHMYSVIKSNCNKLNLYFEAFTSEFSYFQVINLIRILGGFVLALPWPYSSSLGAESDPLPG